MQIRVSKCRVDPDSAFLTSFSLVMHMLLVELQGKCPFKILSSLGHYEAIMTLVGKRSFKSKGGTLLVLP